MLRVQLRHLHALWFRGSKKKLTGSIESTRGGGGRRKAGGGGRREKGGGSSLEGGGGIEKEGGGNIPDSTKRVLTFSAGRF